MKPTASSEFSYCELNRLLAFGRSGQGHCILCTKEIEKSQVVCSDHMGRLEVGLHKVKGRANVQGSDSLQIRPRALRL